MKKLFFSALAATFLISQPMTSNVVLASDDAKAINTKLNVAGRQRMLSQRMAKAACFAYLNVDKSKHFDMLKGAADLFDTSLNSLIKGNEKLGLSEEKNKNILTSYSSVQSLWKGYNKAIQRSLKSGNIVYSDLELIDILNIPTLKQMHYTVNLTEKIYAGESGSHPSLGTAINLAGAQRMLTQKASKEFCFIQSDHEKQSNQKQLSATVTRFDKVLNALIKGDSGFKIGAAPTPEIQNQLKTVSGIWQPLKTILERAANGQSVSDAEIQKLATDNNKLLVEMNKAVQLYVKI